MSLISRLIGTLLSVLDVLILLGVAWLVGELAKRRASAEGLAAQRVGDTTLWLAVGALVGARLAAAASDWPIYLRHPLDLVRIQTGLSFYGAVVGALIVAFWLDRRGSLPLARTADLFAPFLALGIGIDRATCLLRGDCFGALAPPPFGIIFPGLTQPRFPAELYEALLTFGLFGLLIARRGRQSFPGELGLNFLMGYSLLHAAIDFFRINLHGWPSPDQLLSLGLAVAAGSIWVWRLRANRLTSSKGRPDPSQVDEAGRSPVPEHVS